MKTNGGLNSVRGSCGNETSKVKEDGEKETGHKTRVFIFLNFFGNNLPIMPFGNDLCPNRGSPSIDAKTFLSMEFASERRKLYISRA